ncbi:signal peptidase I [Alloscardovia venturai]|uniref:Signal peptidase I n=1 Tax=Alloscardovia venturai TaxID=1769421 RepID=A0ABW2Y3S6_9BIFI
MSSTNKPEHSTGTKLLSKHDERVAGFTDVALYFVLPLSIMLILRFFVFGLFVIPSGSMEDTLAIGSRIVTRNVGINRDTLKRGDVVVFSDDAGWLGSSSASATLESGSASHTLGFGGNKQYLVKRLIGMPGDVVASKGNGAPVTVNGKAIDETSYIKRGVEPSTQAFSVTVPENSIFVMGDNRSNSADSRYHFDDGNSGCVRISSVTGVGLAVFWPISQWHGLGNGRAAFEKVGM